MANWKWKLKIKKLFMTEEDIPLDKLPKMASKVSKRVEALAAKLEKSHPEVEQDLHSLAMEFEDLSSYDDWIERAEFESEFNYIMGKLYDVADAYLIWVE